MSENTADSVSTADTTEVSTKKETKSTKTQNMKNSELRGQPKSGRFWKTKKEKYVHLCLKLHIIQKKSISY